MSIQQQYPNCARTSPGVQAPETNQQALCKRSIIQKTLQVGGSTLGSRVLGIIREVLMVNFLGTGAVADAFITAWKIPNSLRKIFAEGALSAAFIPTLVKLVKQGKRQEASGLMTLGFLVFEGIVLLLCLLVIMNASTVVWFMAPGFSAAQVERAAPFLQILMPFIFFISSSALLAGALQSVNHFFVPAFSPILLNVVFISSLVICLHNKLPVEYLCFFILGGGLLQFLWHLATFLKLQFHFGAITPAVKKIFKAVFAKFGNCLLSMSVMEISLIVDTQFASMLSDGSIALLYYANRFMGIPLGVFVTALSTILLPHFSRVATYAPKRLSFYLLEATKLIFWVTIPVTFFMAFFSEKIFSTIFLSEKFPMIKVYQASSILMVFVAGLFFFSLNRILLNLYYAMHNTLVPATVSIIATVVNIGLNALFIMHLKAPGLALATVLAGMIQTGLYAWYLYRYMHFTFYFKAFFRFVWRYSAQLILTLTAFLLLYYSLSFAIASYLPAGLSVWLLMKIAFWFWVGPLCMLSFAALYYFRRAFGVHVYFLD